MAHDVSGSVEGFWADFCRSSNVDVNEPFQVWYFGNSPEMADELAALVISGQKTATASLLKTNRLQPDKAPIDGGYSVVTDHGGRPVCILQTTEIKQMPFINVDEQFAKDEGEGDMSLEYWRRVHREYFTREAAELGFEFDEDSVVCCERFRLLYTG